MRDEHYLWILAPLVYANGVTRKPGHERMRRRLDGAIKPAWRCLGLEEQVFLGRFGEVIGLWAHSNRERLASYLPEPTIQHLIGLAPTKYLMDTKGAQIYINLFLHETRVVMQCEIVHDRLEIDVAGDGLHRFTTRPWLQWIQNPRSCAECEYCGWVFVPTRSGTRFCSPSCRVSASKDRMDALASNSGSAIDEGADLDNESTSDTQP